MKPLFLAIPLLVLSQVNVLGNTSSYVNFKSNEAQVNLVELFSSEGCSSCPPADKWLSSLRVNRASDLWNKFVPIEFHVDYWNSSSWKDPFSRSEFSRRQRDLTNNVYTPGMMLNETLWPEWRAPNSYGDLKKVAENPGVVEVNQTDRRRFVINFKPSSMSSRESYVVYGSLLGNGLSSSISGGENSGSTLIHDFVALSLKNGKLKRSGEKYSGTIELEDGSADLKPKSYSVAFWVVGDNGMVIQATGHDLKQ